MPEPSYPAARQVAATVQEHFVRHLEVARAQGRIDLGFEPGLPLAAGDHQGDEGRLVGQDELADQGIAALAGAQDVV